MNRPPRSKPRPVNSLAVYDGRTYLGELVELDNGQWQARDQLGRQLGGNYDSRADAERSFFAAQKQGRPRQAAFGREASQ